MRAQLLSGPPAGPPPVDQSLPQSACLYPYDPHMRGYNCVIKMYLLTLCVWGNDCFSTFPLMQQSEKKSWCKAGGSGFAPEARPDKQSLCWSSLIWCGNLKKHWLAFFYFTSKLLEKAAFWNTLQAFLTEYLKSHSKSHWNVSCRYFMQLLLCKNYWAFFQIFISSAYNFLVMKGTQNKLCETLQRNIKEREKQITQVTASAKAALVRNHNKQKPSSERSVEGSRLDWFFSSRWIWRPSGRRWTRSSPMWWES